LSRRLRIVVEYDGTDFSGWQRQVDQRTVQATLEDAIRGMTGETVFVRAAGRTDAGVHALAIDLYGRTAGAEHRGDDFDWQPHRAATRDATIALDVRAAIEELASRGASRAMRAHRSINPNA